MQMSLREKEDNELENQMSSRERAYRRVPAEQYVENRARRTRIELFSLTAEGLPFRLGGETPSSSTSRK